MRVIEIRVKIMRVNQGLVVLDSPLKTRQPIIQFHTMQWFVGFQTMYGDSGPIWDTLQCCVSLYYRIISFYIKSKFRLDPFNQSNLQSCLIQICFFFYQWRPLLTSFCNRRHRECKKDAPCRKRDAPAVYCTLKMVQRLSYRAGERSDTLWTEFTNFIHKFFSFKIVKILFQHI